MGSDTRPFRRAEKSDNMHVGISRQCLLGDSETCGRGQALPANLQSLRLEATIGQLRQWISPDIFTLGSP